MNLPTTSLYIIWHKTISLGGIIMFFTNIIASTIFIGFVCFFVAYHIQKFLVRQEKKWFGLIMPISAFLFSIFFSIPNFKNAIYQSFSLNAFIASLILFFLFNIVTTMLIWQYFKEHKKDSQDCTCER